MKYDLHKVGGILLNDKKVLVCRPKGKETFIAPGGKLEGGESLMDALKRELKEEISVGINEIETEEFGTFYGKASGKEESTLRMDVFFIKQWTGEIKPGSEIEEILWINNDSVGKVKIGSIFEREVIPKLKEMQMID